MVSDFQEKVYSLCRKVPRGRVMTYDEIAKALGRKGVMCRAFGNALNKNPFGAWGRAGGLSCRRQECFVPCHRVMKSDGYVGGFATETKRKIMLLKKEGINIQGHKIIDLEKLLFRFY